MNHNKNIMRGFTLLELLISLVIFAILSTMSYMGLQSVLTAKAVTEAHTDRLIRLQTAFTFMQRDIEQATSRSIRDSFGDEQAALVAGAFGQTLLELTRTGWRNPTGAARSSLQRVGYKLEEEKLLRVSWSMVDQPSDSPPFERILIEQVKDLEFRYLDKDKEWHTTWPDDLSGTGSILTELPIAVELTLTLENMGEIKRIFRVAPGEGAISIVNQPS